MRQISLSIFGFVVFSFASHCFSAMPAEDLVKLAEARDASVQSSRMHLRRAVFTNLAADPAESFSEAATRLGTDFSKSSDVVNKLTGNLKISPSDINWMDIRTVERGERFLTDVEYSNHTHEFSEYDGQLFENYSGSQVDIYPDFHHFAQLRRSDLFLSLGRLLKKPSLLSEVGENGGQVVLQISPTQTTSIVLDPLLALKYLEVKVAGRVVTRQWIIRDVQSKEYFGPRLYLEVRYGDDHHENAVITELDAIKINDAVTNDELKLKPIPSLCVVVDNRLSPPKILRAGELGDADRTTFGLRLDSTNPSARKSSYGAGQ